MSLNKMAAPKGNTFALHCLTSGRPARYSSSEEFGKEIEEYLKYCQQNDEKITITGMALFLGFESRQSFYDYASRKEYSYITKKAQLIVENSYEIHGQTIDIFALKNMGWEDKTGHEFSGDIKITFKNGK